MYIYTVTAIEMGTIKWCSSGVKLYTIIWIHPPGYYPVDRFARSFFLII